jgi:hypothetical protein
MRRKARRLRKPYPPTAKIPDAGLTLFEADWNKSYALARREIIVTIPTGPRGKLALMYPTCAKIGVNPHQD